MHTLRLFCDVARLQSFSLAARAHHVTQSAASQRIAALEERLGVALIDRSVRPLALTAAGELYFREAREILDRYDDLEARVARFHTEPAAGATLVRVDAIYSAGIELLQQVEELFRDRFPQIDVAIRYKRPEEVYDAVRYHQCDLGIVSYPKTWRGVSFMHLRDEPMAVICNPRHPLARSRRIEAAKLKGWAMIGFEPTLPVGRQIRRYLRKRGIEPDVTNVFDNIDTLKNAVAVTDQIAIVPKRTAMREVAAGTLAVIELRPRLRRPLGIIHRRRSGAVQVLPPAVQSFVDVLLELAGPEVDLSAKYGKGKTKRALVGGRA